MKTKIFGAITALVGTATLVHAQCGSVCATKSETKATVATVAFEDARPDIVDVAVSAGQFNTLAAALGAADLVEALKGKGPFTVFAPTDDAFAKLPSATIQFLLRPENKAALTSILTYHVSPGKAMAKEVVSSKTMNTLNGQRLAIEVNGDKVMIGGKTKARIIKTDVTADNGVIHVIDTVILPVDKNLAEVATEAGVFKTLLAAANAAGLVPALTGDGPLTVFAPTDDAFAKLPRGTVENLLKPENKEQLAAILKYHVVAGRVYSDMAVKAGTAKTLQGSNVRITVDDKGQARVNNARIVSVDIEANNGVVHVIDTVILPGN